MLPAAGAQFKMGNIVDNRNATTIGKQHFSTFSFFRFHHSTLWYRQLQEKKRGKVESFFGTGFAGDSPL